MKLVYVTDAFTVWGGMERVLANKMNYLSEHYGYDVVLITVNQGEHSIPFSLNPQVKHVDLGVRLHQQYAYRGVKRFLVHRQLVAKLKEKIRKALQQIDTGIIVCVRLDFVGVLNEVRGRIPLIVESHTLCNADSYEGAGWFRRFHILEYKRQVKKVDTVVALTAGDAKDWQKYNRNVCVIPNVVNINQTDKPIYITSLAQTWNPAIVNSSTGTINITANQANACTSNPNDTTSDLCVYAEGDGTTDISLGNAAIANYGNNANGTMLIRTNNKNFNISKPFIKSK